VLVDRVMPVMDGLSFARALRADPSLGGEEPLRLVLCASGQAGETREGLELFDAQLLKPVLATRLRSVIAMLAAEPAPARLPQAAAPAAEPPSAPLAGMRILVAEDNPTNQIVTRAILQRAGARVEVVEDGAQAVSMVRRFAYDALLMDLQMPGMDGLEATRLIRRDEREDNDGPPRRLRIVGLTAEAGGEIGATCRAAGMDAHLSKPVPRDELIAAVARAHQGVAA
jgi:CheY-like chemotaxis protein